MKSQEREVLQILISKLIVNKGLKDEGTTELYEDNARLLKYGDIGDILYDIISAVNIPNTDKAAKIFFSLSTKLYEMGMVTVLKEIQNILRNETLNCTIVQVIGLVIAVLEFMGGKHIIGYAGNELVYFTHGSRIEQYPILYTAMCEYMRVNYLFKQLKKKGYMVDSPNYSMQDSFLNPKEASIVAGFISDCGLTIDRVYGTVEELQKELEKFQEFFSTFFFAMLTEKAYVCFSDMQYMTVIPEHSACTLKDWKQMNTISQGNVPYNFLFMHLAFGLERNKKLLQSRKMVVRDKGVRIKFNACYEGIQYLEICEMHHDSHIMLFRYERFGKTRTLYLNLENLFSLSYQVYFDSDALALWLLFNWLGVDSKLLSLYNEDDISNSPDLCKITDIQQQILEALNGYVESQKSTLAALSLIVMLPENFTYEEPIYFNYGGYVGGRSGNGSTKSQSSGASVYKNIHIGAFVRKLTSSAQASDDAQAKAKAYCIELPEGYTLVSEHTRCAKIGKGSRGPRTNQNEETGVADLNNGPGNIGATTSLFNT